MTVRPPTLDEQLEAQLPFIQHRNGPLLVIVPGFHSKPHDFSKLLQALMRVEISVDTARLRDADCLPFPCRAPGYQAFTYHAGRFSGVGRDPDTAARHLLDATERRLMDVSSGYPRIYFIGHSFGGLIVRRAMLELLKETAREVPTRWPLLRAQLGQPESVRLVLLASANRGFTSTNLKRWHSTMPFWFSLGERLPWFAQHIVMHAARGAPWINNLRINWLQWRPAKARPSMPTVIQIVGDDDEVVDQDDSLDIFGTSGGYQVTIPQLRHRNFLNKDMQKGYLQKELPEALQKTLNEKTRLDVVRLAFADDTSKLRKFAESQQGIDPDAKPAGTLTAVRPSVVVLLIHGIRDFADWQESLEWAWTKRHRAGGGQVRYIEVRYGYFSAWQFLFKFERDRVARCVADRYSQELARLRAEDRALQDQEQPVEAPAVPIVAVAHSNGTFALARALELHPAMSFASIYLCGSVLSARFPWNRFLRDRQVGMIRNDCASADWPVGVLCPIVRWLPWNWRRPWFFGQRRETVLGRGGVGGFKGAEDLTGKLANNQYLRGDHGVALGSKNADEIWKFIESNQLQHALLPAETDDPIVTSSIAHGRLLTIAAFTGLGLALLVIAFLLGVGTCESMSDLFQQNPTLSTFISPVQWWHCFLSRFHGDFPWLHVPSPSFFLTGLFALVIAWGITLLASRI